MRKILVLWAMIFFIAPNLAFGQQSLAIFPSQIQPGQSILVVVPGGANMTVDVVLRVNNDPTMIINNWITLDVAGMADVPISSDTAEGTYTITGVRNSSNKTLPFTTSQASVTVSKTAPDCQTNVSFTPNEDPSLNLTSNDVTIVRDGILLGSRFLCGLVEPNPLMKSVEVIVAPGTSATAAASGREQITIFVQNKWSLQSLVSKIGILVHEYTHLLQTCPFLTCPSSNDLFSSDSYYWFTEGMAEDIRYRTLDAAGLDKLSRVQNEKAMAVRNWSKPLRDVDFYGDTSLGLPTYALSFLAVDFLSSVKISPFGGDFTISGYGGNTQSTFSVGDQWQMKLSAGPMIPVYLHFWKNGEDMGTSGPFGQTDKDGRWVLSGGIDSPSQAGVWSIMETSSKSALRFDVSGGISSGAKQLMELVSHKPSGETILFQNIFGMSQDDFYKMFEQFRSQLR